MKDICIAIIVSSIFGAAVGVTVGYSAKAFMRIESPCTFPPITFEQQRLLDAIEQQIFLGRGVMGLLSEHRLYRRGETEHITPEEAEEFTRAAIKLYKTGE